MNNEVYDIFISYRREGGFDVATQLSTVLSNKGYSVWFDLKEMRSGRFDKALLSHIEGCRDFLLIVDAHCFDKTLDNTIPKERDWVRIELAYALECKKNIIPILLPNASFPPGLPEDIAAVSNYHGPGYNKEYFDAFCSKLINLLYSLPRPVPTNENGNRTTILLPVHNLKVRSNKARIVYIDGACRGRVEKNELKMFPLSEGEYQMRFVSEDDQSDIFEDSIMMSSNDKLYDVDRVRECHQCKIKRLCGGRRIDDVKNCWKKQWTNHKIYLIIMSFFVVATLFGVVYFKGGTSSGSDDFVEHEKKEKISVSGVDFMMVYVVGGAFEMGATEICFMNDSVHEVILNDYYISETEVTQALWKAVMHNNPSGCLGDDLPVENVSWCDAQEFVMKLCQLTGRTFRLPTEAEWEYAARGGNKSQGYRYSGSNDINAVAWYWQNSGDKFIEGDDSEWDLEKIKKNKSCTHRVNGKKPNELGLFDMSGNVWEWCQDWYGSYSKESQTNPTGPDCGLNRVCRGGSWCCGAIYCPVFQRSYNAPFDRASDLGFRLVLVPNSTVHL